MTRRTVVSAGVAALAGAPAVAQPRRRNVVFVLSDDHRYDMMGFMGHPWLQTPHLDKLAERGAHFQNAFVTTALCSPSRASILTGQYMHAHGVTDNVSPFPKGRVTFPELLQKAGYRTGFMGKWHMGGDSDEPRPGFDHWLSFRGQGVYVDPTFNVNGQRRQVKGYVSDLLTEEALRFLGANQNRPFCLYLSHKAVHSEFVPAERHKDRYANERIPYPASMANSEETYRGKPEWVRRQRDSWHGVDGMYNKQTNFDQFYRDYCRTLAGLDDSVGAVMNELEQKKLLDNTVVIYMGDNGFLFGEHGLIDKRCMYEPSMRVPMLAHWPGVKAGTKIPQMALNLDIAPTILEAAGVKIPAAMHGRSLLPLFEGKTDGWRREFLYEYNWERDFPQTPTVQGLRTDRYSLMQYHGVWDLDELYDIEADPQQRTNLLADVRTKTEAGRLFMRIKDPQLKELVADLQKRKQAILEQTGGRAEPTWSRQAN
ncbi:MAG: sulfatase [Bryobacteraceae bacterium]|nr:sulfatase [Bryobacteraceae bacterium]